MRDSNTILCTNLQTFYTEGLERLRRMKDYSCHARKQASRHVTLNLLRDGVIACCGS